MIQDTDEQIETRNMYAITQEHQIDRTVRELMTLYNIHHLDKAFIQDRTVIARYTLQFFSDTTNSVGYTDFAFSVDLDAEVHKKGSIWDFTDKAKTRACVEHCLRGEIDKNYKKYGELGYLKLKYVF